MMKRSIGAGPRALVAIAVAFLAAQAWAQEPPARPALPGARSTTADTATVRDAGPPLTAYPAELLGLLAPPAERGPVTLRPSIAVSEEFNDNVRLDNRARQWDFITRVSPGITLTVNRPSYQLTAGYTLSGEVYANESELNDAFKNQTFVANALYRGIRGLTLTAADSFALNRSTNQVASQGFATGQQETWNNAFTPGLAWEMTPRTSLNLSGTFGVQRFLDAGTAATPGFDSNTYGLQTTVTHTLTPRLSGSVGYGFTYLDFLGEEDNSRTHTPTLGVTYVLTPTLTASVSGGPAITELGGNTVVSPAATAKLVQVFQSGVLSLDYSRSVQAAGGFGGTTDSQTISIGLVLPTLMRDLIVTFSPTYNTATSVSDRQGSRVDVQALTVPLAVSYQLARFTSVFAEYAFFHQHTASSSSFRNDVDQNRVRFGVQFGYPINFD
jgi:hypothetical protein